MMNNKFKSQNSIGINVSHKLFPSLNKENKKIQFMEPEWEFSLKKIEKFKIRLSASYQLRPPNDTFVFCGYNDWDQALFLIKTRKAIYEDFLECKGYIDFEYLIPWKFYQENKNTHDLETTNRFNVLNDAIEITAKQMMPGSKIMIAKSHGKIRKNSNEFMKISFHFVVNGDYRFKNSCDAKQFADAVVEELRDHENGEEIIKFIDYSVYKKDPESFQKFRCIGSYKSSNDLRILEATKNNQDTIPFDTIQITDYLVSHINDNQKIIYLPSYQQKITGTEMGIDLFGLPSFDSLVTSKNKATIRKSKKKNQLNHNLNQDNQENQGDNLINSEQGIIKIDDHKQKIYMMILEKLKKIILSVKMETVSHVGNDGFLPKGIDFYQYNYNHSKHKCVYGCDHDHIGGYAYILGGSWVYAGCYSSKCKPLSATLIGSLLEESFWTKFNISPKTQDNQKFDFKQELGKKVNIINNRRLLTSNVKKIIDNFVQNDETKALSICSPMGSGKTYALNYVIKKLFEIHGENARGLLISTRRSYAQDIENTITDLKFTNYLKKVGDLRDENRLIISLESLHRIMNHEMIKHYNFIILDEIESVLTNVFSQMITDPRTCFSRFMNMLKHASKIVSMDADMDNRAIDFIENITPDHRIIKNNFRNKPKKIIISNDYTKYIEAIARDIEDGKKVVMVSLCKAAVQNVTEAMIERFPHLVDKMLCLHSDSSQSDKDGMANVNKVWTDKVFLAFSPIVGVGVNYSVLNHFDKMYGYAVGESDTVRVFLQMMGRIRHLGSNEIIVAVSPKMNLSINAQLFSLEYAEKYYDSIIQRDHDESSTILFKNEQGQLCETQKISSSVWNRLRAYKIQEELNSSSNNFITMLKHKVEANGDTFEMNIADGPVKKVAFKKDIDRIIAVPLLTEKEYEKLCESNDLKENDKYSMKKIQMKHELSLKDNIKSDELNPCLKIYSDNQKQIENVLNYYKINDEKVDNKDEYEHAKIQNINSAFKKVINALGCEFIPINTGEIIGQKMDDCDSDKKIEDSGKITKKTITGKSKNEDSVSTYGELNKKTIKKKINIMDDIVEANIPKEQKKIKKEHNNELDKNEIPDDNPINEELPIDDETMNDNYFLKYEQKYFEDKIDKINFTEGEINSLKTNGRAKNKYEIIKIVLSRFGIRASVESKQKYIEGSKRKSIRTYKIFYDVSIWSILHCKTIHCRAHYSDDFIEYVKCFVKYDKFIKKKTILKKLF